MECDKEAIKGYDSHSFEEHLLAVAAACFWADEQYVDAGEAVADIAFMLQTDQLSEFIDYLRTQDKLENITEISLNTKDEIFAYLRQESVVEVLEDIFWKGFLTMLEQSGMSETDADIAAERYYDEGVRRFYRRYPQGKPL